MPNYLLRHKDIPWAALCLGLRAHNNETGQPCFHSATLYVYDSLLYPLSFLTIMPSQMSCSLSSYLLSPLPMICNTHLNSRKKKAKHKTKRVHAFFTVPRSTPTLSHAGFLFFISFSVVKRNRRGWKGKKIRWCFPSNMWPLPGLQLKIIWVSRPVDGWRKPSSPSPLLSPGGFGLGLTRGRQAVVGLKLSCRLVGKSGHFILLILLKTTT